MFFTRSLVIFFLSFLFCVNEASFVFGHALSNTYTGKEIEKSKLYDKKVIDDSKNEIEYDNSNLADMLLDVLEGIVNLQIDMNEIKQKIDVKLGSTGKKRENASLIKALFLVKKNTEKLLIKAAELSYKAEGKLDDIKNDIANISSSQKEKSDAASGLHKGLQELQEKAEQISEDFKEIQEGKIEELLNKYTGDTKEKVVDSSKENLKVDEVPVPKEGASDEKVGDKVIAPREENLVDNESPLAKEAIFQKNGLDEATAATDSEGTDSNNSNRREEVSDTNSDYARAEKTSVQQSSDKNFLPDENVSVDKVPNEKPSEARGVVADGVKNKKEPTLWDVASSSNDSDQYSTEKFKGNSKENVQQRKEKVLVNNIYQSARDRNGEKSEELSR